MSPRRKRVITTSSLCAVVSALWIAPSAVLESADVTLMTAAVGVLGPAGIAALCWALTFKQAADLDTTTPWPPPSAEAHVRGHVAGGAR
jgi:hypothetical protein